MSATESQLSLDLAFEDWTELLSRALELRGFDSLTAYADSQPTASLAELAAELVGDIPAVVLEQELITEARAAGKMERCARSLLVRNLHANLPDGWQTRAEASGDEVSDVFFALGMALPAAYEDAIARVQRAMSTADLPSGWLPSGPDDPALVELFASCWIARSAGGAR